MPSRPLQTHVCIYPVVSGSCCFLGVIHYLWLIKSYFLLFRIHLWAVSKGFDEDLPIRASCSKAFTLQTLPSGVFLTLQLTLTMLSVHPAEVTYHVPEVTCIMVFFFNLLKPVKASRSFVPDKLHSNPPFFEQHPTVLSAPALFPRLLAPFPPWDTKVQSENQPEAQGPASLKHRAHQEKSNRRPWLGTEAKARTNTPPFSLTATCVQWLVTMQTRTSYAWTQN